MRAHLAVFITGALVAGLMTGGPAGSSAAATDREEPVPESYSASIYGSVGYAEPPAGVDLSRSEVYVTLTTESTGATRSMYVDYFGRYDFSGLPGGRYTLSYYQIEYGDNDIYAPTFWPDAHTRQSAQFFTLEVGEQLELDGVLLQIGGSITGHVTGIKGAVGGLSNVYVRASSVSDDGYGGSATTDSAGKFTMQGLSPGSYRLEFDASYTNQQITYASEWWGDKYRESQSQLISLSLGQKFVASQGLDRGATISGRILDESNRPMAASAVAYFAEDGADTWDSFVTSAASDSDGRYTLRGLPPGAVKVGFTSVVEVAVPTISRGFPGYFNRPTTDTGSLAPAWPYVPVWYKTKPDYATAASITVARPGQALTGISGKLIYDPDFAQAWPDEKAGNGNPAEPNCDCSYADPVNAASGELYENLVDVSVSGVGPELSIGRNYSSQAALVDGPFGPGWSADFSARLKVVIPGVGEYANPEVVETVQENGSTLRFVLDMTGRYVAPPRVNARLEQLWNGTWELTRNEAERLLFASDGRVVSKSDLNGNAVDYSYGPDGNLSELTASGGRFIRLTWEDQHVAQAIDSAGRSVTYSYDADEMLTSVASVDLSVESYVYGETGQMISKTHPNGGVTVTTYDLQGRVASQIDPVGRKTSFAYETEGGSQTSTIIFDDGSRTVEKYVDGRLTTSIAAEGTSKEAITRYRYDIANNVTSLIDSMNKTTKFTFDADGNRLTQVDALSNLTSWEYDSMGNVTSITDPLGRRSSSQYDGAGNLISTTNPSGAVETRSYNSDGTLSSAVNALGFAATYTYDAAGRPITAVDPEGNLVGTEYDAAGFVVSTTDANGGVTRSTLDAMGRKLQVTDPSGVATTNRYDAEGNLTRTIDGEGRKRVNRYSAAGELLSTTDAEGATVKYVYGARGRLAVTIEPTGARTRYRYDLLGRHVLTVDAIGRRTTMSYDKLDRLLSTKRSDGTIVSSEYDALGRKISETSPTGSRVSWNYDVAGQPVNSTDEIGRVTIRTFDDMGRVSATTFPDGSTETMTYDALGEVISSTDAAGFTTNWSRDTMGRVIQQDAPFAGPTTYSYGPHGLVTEVGLPDGSVRSFQYDANMRRVSSSSDGGVTADSTYAYNAAGEVVSMTDHSGTSTYTRNKNGLLTSVVDGGGEQLGYERDAVGRVVKMTYPGDRDVAYQYDAVGQMTGLTDWLGRAWQYEWTSMGEVSSQTNPNGTSESRAYDQLGRLTQMSLAAGTTETLDYAYNAAGELLSEHGSGTSFAPFDYEFDLKGQLTEANSDGVPQSFEASPNAALLANGTNGVLARNDRQQLETRTAPDQSAVEFVHDSNGSRTTETTRLVGEIEPASIVSYEYGPEGGLTGYTREGAEPVDVTYITDGDGLRQSRTSAGVTSELLWNVISGAPLLISDTAHDFVYGPLATPVAQVDKASGQIDYLHSDLIGSVRWISSATGAIIASQQFDAYGSRKGGVGVVASAIGFTGAWTDPDTQLVYLRSRDLDPTTGQFITVDPAVATTHQPYAYASANPVQKVDPTGRSPQSGAETASGDRPTSDSVWWQAAGIGALASVVAVRAALCVTATCRAAASTFLSYAGTAEGQVILGWALGFAAPEMHYGSDTGLVAHLKGTRQTVDPQNTLRTRLAAGVAIVGDPLASSYRAGSPGLGNDNFLRDAWTYSHWASASDSDRVYAALGTYDLEGTVKRIDERCRIATVLYLGFNDTTFGSAVGPTGEIRDLLNEFAEGTGVLSKVRQTFSWTEYVRY